MDNMLNDIISSEDLKKFESVYYEELKLGELTTKTQFEYGWCLIRSKYPVDIKKGLVLLENLFECHDDCNRRDCLYYMAIGNARIKEYSKALKYVRTFLEIEPGNEQVQDLEISIKKKMEQEALKGMAVAGGVIVGLAGILGLGIAMAKK